MAEYIEREALINELSASCMPIDNREIPGLLGCNESIRDIIDAMPATDVRPERYGEWLERNDGGEGFVCGGCNGGYTLYDETPFCPNCGAKMDGKDGESG